MTIETKYNIGDEVWYSLKGNIYHNVIDLIRIGVTNESVSIWYSWNKRFPMEESLLYPTKEELIKSL